MNFLNIFEYFMQFFTAILFYKSLLVQDTSLVFSSKIKKVLFKIALGNLEKKIFFGTQPYWTSSKLNYEVMFAKKTHKSYLKS